MKKLFLLLSFFLYMHAALDEKIDQEIRVFTELAARTNHDNYIIFTEFYNKLQTEIKLLEIDEWEKNSYLKKIDAIKKNMQTRLFGDFKKNIGAQLDSFFLGKDSDEAKVEKLRLLDDIKKHAAEYEGDPGLFIKLIESKFSRMTFPPSAHITTTALLELDHDLTAFTQIILEIA